MQLSKFGEKFTGNSGILQLMDDLGNAVAQNKEVIMLGGGNPSLIPEVQQQIREQMQHLLADGQRFDQLVGKYGPPQGDRAFTKALASLLHNEYGWPLSEKNIVLTNGSQTAFFGLFNILAGLFPDGSHQKILLPLAPEYIGYLDVGLVDDLFVTAKPEFEYLDEHIFKYHVNFDALNFETISGSDKIGAICVSRPTNPTGNVLTDDEVEKLCSLAQTHNIPFIIDNAYGTPFPSIIFTEAQPVWNENIVLCMSLSKLGIPGTRTGIIIANEQIAGAIAGLNAVMSLAPNSFGATLALDWVQSGEIIRLGHTVIKPFYQQQAKHAITQLHKNLAGCDYYIHKPEGAFFLWLWFKGLPITSQQLYQRLKKRGVIIVPGEYFFPGIQGQWAHMHECIRMSYAQDAALVSRGTAIIAEEVKKAYQE